MMQERLLIAMTSLTRNQVNDIINIGVLRSENQIMQYQYINCLKAHSYKDFNGMDVKEYASKYPIKFNPDKGYWDNA